MSREAMQMALDAFDYFFPTEDGQLWHTANDVKKIDEARQALQQALETEHEPVAHVYLFDKAGRPLVAWDNAKDIQLGDKLYAAPKQWVGLTDEEVSEIIDREIGFNSCWGPEEKFARAIEQALKEKNNG
jgi:hypothetical protein